MSGFDEPLWDQLAKAMADINAWLAAMESRQAAFARQVSAAVRLQAAARGLLARRRVRRLWDLQLIQPRTPSQFLQAVLRRAKADTAQQIKQRKDIAAQPMLIHQPPSNNKDKTKRVSFKKPSSCGHAHFS
jgi:hypothetical protein